MSSQPLPPLYRRDPVYFLESAAEIAQIVYSHLSAYLLDQQIRPLIQHTARLFHAQMSTPDLVGHVEYIAAVCL